MPALAISPQDQARVIIGVAVKYKIPLNALLGIYGKETGFGTNVTYSSTGAVGPFQFEPATANQYGYPQTNTPNLQQFQQQADAWGRYLVANNPSRSASGWAPAMRGGYTEAQAEATLGGIPHSLASAIGSLGLQTEASGVNIPGGSADFAQTGGVAGTLDQAAQAVGNIGSIADVVGKIFSFLTTPANWLRILEFIAGAVLVFKGLMALSGTDTKITQIATTAARTVK